MIHARIAEALGYRRAFFDSLALAESRGKELIIRIFRKHAADVRTVFAEIPLNQLEQLQRTLKIVGRRAEQFGLGEEQRG